MGGQGGRRGIAGVPGALLLGVLVLVAGAPAAEARIAVGDARVSERARAVTFSITRDARSLAPAVTVGFATADGSATAPADYAAAAGSRTFPGTLLPATQTHHVTVAVAADALDEPDETFRLTIGGPEVSDGVGVATIVDDDPPPSVRALDAPPAVEGASALFTVALSAPSGRNVSVAVATADGSAVAGQDYSARAGVVTIPAGATSAALGVPLLDDDADEVDESFELRLSSPSAATLGDARARATIVDNDDPPAAVQPPPPQAPPPPPAPPPGPVGGPPAIGSSAGGGMEPRIGLSAPRLRLPSTILVTMSCPRQAGRCRGRLTVFSRPNRRSKLRALRLERRLARRSFGLAGGRSQTLRMRLSRRDRALVRRAGRMRVRAYVVMTDAAGRTGVRRVNGTLVARTSHSG